MDHSNSIAYDDNENSENWKRRQLKVMGKCELQIIALLSTQLFNRFIFTDIFYRFIATDLFIYISDEHIIYL